MLKILTGNHTFLRQQALFELKQKANILPEIISADNLSVAGFNDLVSAQSLFVSVRLVIIYNLANNTEVWAKFTELAEGIADDDGLSLVLVEDKIDSRTKFFKLALKQGWLENFAIEVDSAGRVRDFSGQKSVKFILEQAEKLKLGITRLEAEFLFRRVGADPWELYNSLLKLSAVGRVDKEAIKKFIPQNTMTNVFEILNKVLSGKQKEVMLEIDELERSDAEPHQFFGLLASQMFNAVALVLVPIGASVEADFGVNSWALGSLRAVVRNYSPIEIKKIIEMFVATDQKIKTGSTDLWLEIRVLLTQIASIKK